MISDRGINSNGGQKLKLALLANNTKAKLRKSSKHKVNPDRFTQLTLQVKTSESINCRIAELQNCRTAELQNCRMSEL